MGQKFLQLTLVLSRSEACWMWYHVRSVYRTALFRTAQSGFLAGVVGDRQGTSIRSAAGTRSHDSAKQERKIERSEKGLTLIEVF